MAISGYHTLANSFNCNTCNYISRKGDITSIAMLLGNNNYILKIKIHLFSNFYKKKILELKMFFLEPFTFHQLKPKKCFFYEWNFINLFLLYNFFVISNAVIILNENVK